MSVTSQPVKARGRLKRSRARGSFFSLELAHPAICCTSFICSVNKTFLSPLAHCRLTERQHALCAEQVRPRACEGNPEKSRLPLLNPIYYHVTRWKSSAPSALLRAPFAAPAARPSRSATARTKPWSVVALKLIWTHDNQGHCYSTALADP